MKTREGGSSQVANAQQLQQQPAEKSSTALRHYRTERRSKLETSSQRPTALHDHIRHDCSQSASLRLQRFLRPPVCLLLERRDRKVSSFVELM